MTSRKLFYTIKLFATRHPMASNMTFYGLLYGAGDLSRQTFQGCVNYDVRSAARMAIIGTFVIAPLNFNWYKLLDKKIQGTSVRLVMKKVVLDQVVFAPVGISLFYIGHSVLERKEQVLDELRLKGVNTYLAGTAFWPLFQCINFAFVPSSFRVFYVGAIAFVWTNIMSYLKSSKSSPNWFGDVFSKASPIQEGKTNTDIGTR